MKPALVWKGVCKPKSLSFLACEQAPLFGRAKRAARERASMSTFHDIPQALVVQTFDSAIHRLTRPQSSLIISIQRGRLERAF